MISSSKLLLSFISYFDICCCFFFFFFSFTKLLSFSHTYLYSFVYFHSKAGDSNKYTRTQTTETVTSNLYRPVDFRLPVGGGQLNDITGMI